MVAVTDADIVDYGDLSRSDAKRGDPNGWGNFIVYKDANGYFHLYGHLNSIIKKSGRVKRGEKIATVGNTGRSSGPHLHWELGTGWTGGTIEGKSDPLSYYSVMAPFRLSGGKQKANLAPPNRNVASGLGDMTDYEQGGVGEIALLPIVEQVETMSKSPSGGGGVIVLNSNAPSRFAPALIGNMSFTKAAESGNITRFEIYPNLFKNESPTEKNKKKPTSLLGGTVELYYYESIFENSVKITTTIVDTGNALPADDGTNAFVELIDGLKVGGGEKIFLDFEDNQGTKLKFSRRKCIIFKSTS